MGKIKGALLVLLASLTALWLLADTLMPTPLTYGAFRNVFMQYSGVIAMGAMSAAMILALRPKWLEPHLAGLDKMYRLHKWLGITALVTSIAHWWLGQGTKWMTQWGWIVRPPRGPRPNPADLGLIEGWLRTQRGLAESLGEWAFYLAAILLVLALIKRFPYHLFQKTHKWLAAAYLVFVYHTIVLTKISYWSQPVGWVLALLMIGGSIAAVLSLFGKIGAKRKVRGMISTLQALPDLRVLETGLVLDKGWAGHTAGQFAFVTFDPKEGAHPYTIASAWNPDDRSITFITKALGDHTGQLHARLKLGAPVTVEGPYGCFDFNDQLPRQIWIGAGIGITPFIARMKQRVMNGETRPVDLFYSTRFKDPLAVARLRETAHAASVSLHIIESRSGERLDGEKIRALVPNWSSASLWFCGPSAFAQALLKDFVGQGLSPSQFHHELFEMR